MAGNRVLLENRPRLQDDGGSRRMWFWSVLWEPRDVWIGVYWDRPKGTGWSWALDVYVCLFPCVPLKIAARWMLPSPDGPMAPR
jgi:hypothetical protein